VKKIMIYLILLTSVSSAAIKTAVYWTSPVMAMTVVPKLAKFDLVIVDAENMVNNYQVLDSLKRSNHQIILLAYWNAQEVWESDRTPNRPIQNALIDSLQAKYPSWYLKTANGRSAVFYPRMLMMNMSDQCPVYHIAGKSYNYREWITAFLLKTVLSDPIWNGYFLDNGGGNVSWVSDGIDADYDGQPDESFILDHYWSRGVYRHLLTIRAAKGKNFIIIANKGSVEFMDVLNGRKFEGFSNEYLGDSTDHGWWQSMANAHQTGPYTILQAERERDLDFVLASALMLDHDVFVAVGQNNPTWYQQFDKKFQVGGKIKVVREQDGQRIEIIPSQKTGQVMQK